MAIPIVGTVSQRRDGADGHTDGAGGGGRGYTVHRGRQATSLRVRRLANGTEWCTRPGRRQRRPAGGRPRCRRRGADGDGAGLDRGQLHGGAGYRADGECRGDGGRARGHGRDPGPGHPDVHRVELEHRADGDGDCGRRCGHHGRYGRADPQRGERGQRLQRHRDRRGGGDGERQRHRAGDGADGHTGQRATGDELDGGGQRHGLQGAVEVGQRGLHHQPAVHGHLRFDHEPHDHGPRQRHRIHGAGERDADRRQRRPGVGGEDGHAGRADRAGGHGVDDGADGDGAGLDRGQLHRGAGYRADGECRGDGRRALGHGRDREPDHPDVHRAPPGAPRRRWQ